ncbi:MAG: tetratricopeptide repeat protein, partial [Phycisphaeraceae bacterium]|nr:tetratricopeptide repeat protein [Phycisphaeraceae bacterium]
MNLDHRTQSQADNDWAQVVPDAGLVSQAFEAAHVSDHTDPAVQLTLARLFHAKGRYREAMDMLESLMQRYPDAPDLLEEAGQLAEQFGEDEQADRYLRCAASRGGTLALVGLATVQMHAGRVAPAAWLWWRIARLANVERAAAIEAWAALAVCATAAACAAAVAAPLLLACHGQDALALFRPDADEFARAVRRGDGSG